MGYPIRVERSFVDRFLSDNRADPKKFESALDQSCVFPYCTAVIGFWVGCLYASSYVHLFAAVLAGYLLGVVNLFHADVFFTLYLKKIFYFFESRTFRLFNLILICSFCVFSRAYLFIPVFIAGVLCGALIRFCVDRLIFAKKGLGLMDRQALIKLTDFIADPYSRKYETVLKAYEDFAHDSQAG